MKKVALEVVQGGDGTPEEPNWQGFLSDDLDLDFVRNQWRSITNAMKDAQTISVANGHAIMRLVYGPSRVRSGYANGRRARRCAQNQGSSTKGASLDARQASQRDLLGVGG